MPLISIHQEILTALPLKYIQTQLLLITPTITTFELEVHNNASPPSKGDRPLTSEVRGLSMSLKTLRLLLFFQDPKELFCSLVSLPQTKRHLRDIYIIMVEDPATQNHQGRSAGVQGNFLSPMSSPKPNVLDLVQAWSLSCPSWGKGPQPIDSFLWASQTLAQCRAPRED